MTTRDKIATLANDAAKSSGGSGAVLLTASSSRAYLIRWLSWNDANGTFTDSDCAAEGMDPLTLSEAWDLVASAVDA